jgi:RimJ/RimL family protein N-acetyltransferase
MMKVDAERLYLRPLTEADCTPLYLSWLQDPNVNQFLETRHHTQTMEAIKQFVTGVNARDDEHLFGIFLKEGDRHIGNIKVGPVRPYHALADVSLFIGAQDCWGKGYAREAIAAVSRHAFDKLGVRKLLANMYAPNRGSSRAFEKVGYRREGVRRAHYWLAGQPCDLIEYGLLRADLNHQ